MRESLEECKLPVLKSRGSGGEVTYVSHVAYSLRLHVQATHWRAVLRAFPASSERKSPSRALNFGFVFFLFFVVVCFFFL